jgi:deoxyguanosine kinase
MGVLSTAFIGLGTNQGNRIEILRQALLQLEKSAGKIINSSSVYESQALGFDSGFLFLNAVVELQTALSAEVLLSLLHKIEHEAGRKRSANQRYTDRTLDLDLLYFNDLQCDLPGLRLPHPRISERRFVLEPMAEIAPAWMDPEKVMNISEMLVKCGDASVLAVYPKSVK